MSEEKINIQSPEDAIYILASLYEELTENDILNFEKVAKILRQETEADIESALNVVGVLLCECREAMNAQQSQETDDLRSVQLANAFEEAFLNLAKKSPHRYAVTKAVTEVTSERRDELKDRLNTLWSDNNSNRLAQATMIMAAADFLEISYDKTIIPTFKIPQLGG